MVKKRKQTGMKLKVGDCVIVNCIEQPCARMVAVVTKASKKKQRVHCKYLNSESCFDPFNDPTMKPAIARVTKLTDFGVKLHFDEVTQQYWCEQLAQSVAKYEDGQLRPWQDHKESLKYSARPDVLKLVETRSKDTCEECSGS